MIIEERTLKETGREYALRNIRQNIVSLELEPGAVLSENELAARLGLSRTPVREALVELSRSRIVEILPQRGSKVALMDTRTIREAFFIRLTLECAVAEKMAEQPDSEILKRMREEVQLMEVFAESSLLRFLEADNRFHRLIFEGAGCLMSHEIVSSVLVHMDRVRMLLLKFGRPEAAAEEADAPQATAEHRRIIEAIEQGDAAGVGNLMRGHLSVRMPDGEILKRTFPKWFT